MTIKRFHNKFCFIFISNRKIYNIILCYKFKLIVSKHFNSTVLCNNLLLNCHPTLYISKTTILIQHQFVYYHCFTSISNKYLLPFLLSIATRMILSTALNLVLPYICFPALSCRKKSY